jgi:hypothetical protein
MNRRLPYSEYERRRLGDPATRRTGIGVMVRRSFGAASFGGFWRFWNPLFGYTLLRWCYTPLARRVPRPVAVVLTFAMSGALHDVAASLATWSVYVLFVPAFLIFGLLVVVEEERRWDVDETPFWLRATIHTGVIAGTIAAGVLLRGALL